MTVALGTLTTFTFYQLTLSCTSSITTFLCAAALILTIGFLTAAVIMIYCTAIRPDGITHLFTKGSPYARRWGSLYDVLSEKRLPFMIPLLALVVMRSAVVGFGQHNGLAQVITILALEVITCVGERRLMSLRCFFLAYTALEALFKFHPYHSTGYNRVSYMLAGTKAFSNLLLLFFADKLNINVRHRAGGLAPS
jgi:Transient receptor potential (TRP) ion channel